MGNSVLTSIDPRLSSATRSFTKQELQDLKSLFVSLSSQSQSNGRYISPSVFQAYYGILGPLGLRMFDLITQKRKDNQLTYEDLIITKGVYEKGTRDEIEQFIYQLLDINSDGYVGWSDLEAVLASLLEILLPPRSDESEFGLHHQFIKIVLNAASFSTKIEGSDENTMSFDDFRKWCRLLPSLRKFLGSLLSHHDSGWNSELPILIFPRYAYGDFVIMKKGYAWIIAGGLSQDELGEWSLLYNSAIDGLSFSTFLGNVSKSNDPTVLLIKDKEGCIYGGYASQPWERNGDFYGDMKSFLFQLYPQASLFRPTGANHNLQWCASNFSSENIPNGIGFGGRVNHFGFFISATFDDGHTFSCTTFNNPCLSKSSKVHPEVIECWSVIRGQGRPQEKMQVLKGTVLERFKEDRNMLNMVGLASASE